MSITETLVHGNAHSFRPSGLTPMQKLTLKYLSLITHLTLPTSDLV